MQTILGLVVLVLDIVAILDIVKGAKSGGQKALWIILVLVLPIIGLIAYYLIGRKK